MASIRTPPQWFGHVYVVFSPIGVLGCHAPSPRHWTTLFPVQILVTHKFCGSPVHPSLA